MAHRPERLAESMRAELCDLIAGEMADPRVGLATVTEVKIEPGLHVAQVFVAVTGAAAEQRTALQALMGARGYLRSELSSRLQIRQVPELRFNLDRSDELSVRLDKLLRRARKRPAARREGEPESQPSGGNSRE